METSPRIISDMKDYVTQFGGDKYFGYACDALGSTAAPEFPEILTKAIDTKDRIGEAFSYIKGFADISSETEMRAWLSRNRHTSDTITSTSRGIVKDLCNVLQLANYALTVDYHTGITNSGDFMSHTVKALLDTPQNLLGIFDAYIKRVVGRSELELTFGLYYADKLQEKIDSYLPFLSRYYAMVSYFSILRDALSEELGRRDTSQAIKNEELLAWDSVSKGIYQLIDRSPVPRPRSDLQTYAILVEEIGRLDAVLQIWKDEIALEKNRSYYLSDTPEANQFFNIVRSLQRDTDFKDFIEDAGEYLIDLASKLGERLYGMRSVPVDITVQLSDAAGKLTFDPFMLRVLYRLDENGQVCGFLPLSLSDPRYVIRIPNEASFKSSRGGTIVTDSSGWPMLYFDFQFIDLITGQILYLTEIDRYADLIPSSVLFR